MPSIVPPPFKPFLVENSTNVFRIMDKRDGPSDEPLSRQQIEMLFAKLPIKFDLRFNAGFGNATLNEALEVYFFNNGLIFIYPPKDRVIISISVDFKKTPGTVVVMDMAGIAHPGSGQIKSTLYVNLPAIGITDWPGCRIPETMAVEAHSLPKDSEKRRQIKPPHVRVENLIQLIAGKAKDLTVEHVSQWRDLIMYAVLLHRNDYDNPDVPVNDASRQYFQPCWQAFDTAKTEEQLRDAVIGLCDTISWK